MKHTLAPIIELNDLREAMFLQYGRDFMDPIKLSFFDLAEMNSYIRISFDDEAFADNVEEHAYCEDYRPEEVERVTAECCVMTYLADTIPNFDYVLVHYIY